MNAQPRRRRLVVSAVLGTALAAAQLAQTQVAHATDPLPKRVCHFAWWRGTAEVKATIRCAAHRWEVRGGADKALRVADCESGFNPKARGHGYGGVYQHLVSAWPDRAAFYGFDRHTSVFNGRANTIVAIRMAHRSESWAAWGNCA